MDETKTAPDGSERNILLPELANAITILGEVQNLKPGYKVEVRIRSGQFDSRIKMGGNLTEVSYDSYRRRVCYNFGMSDGGEINVLNSRKAKANIINQGTSIPHVSIPASSLGRSGEVRITYERDESPLSKS